MPMALSAIKIPEEVVTSGRRTVANIVAEIECQRAGYLATLRGNETEIRNLLAKMAACDAILDSPVVTSRSKS